MAVMSKLADNAYDLAICDPPYGIGKALVTGGATSGGWHRMVASGADKWDVSPPAEYFDELRRVSKNQIIWGGNYFPLPPCRKPICWDKVRPNQQNASEWEYAWTSFEGRARLFSHCANGGFIIPGPRIHPTQKPVALYAWLLAEFAEPGQRILDTHMGSGSSVIAAVQAGFEMLACEIDAEYYAAAVERIGRELQQETFAMTRNELS